MSGHVGDLSPLQEQALQQLKSEVESDDHTLLRFLRARAFNVADALQMYKNFINFRKEVQLDKILQAQLPKNDLFKKLYPHAYHGFDREGRPIYIEKTGMIDYNILEEHFTDEELFLHHLYCMERQVERCKESSQRLGKHIDTFCSIIDLTNLNMGHRKGVKFIKMIAQHDQAYYPERMGKLYVINAPWVFPVFWKLCSVWIDKNTRDKIVVLGKNYKTELQKFIAADQLPEEYGGTCVCDGKNKPCVPVHNVADLDIGTPAKREVSVLSDVVQEKVIAARDVFELKLAGHDSGSTFEWSFNVASKDIKFSVDVFDAEGKALAKSPEHPNGEILSSHTGVLRTKSASTLVLRWDNTHSYMTSKTISYTAKAIPYTEDDAEFSINEMENKQNDALSKMARLSLSSNVAPK